MLAVIDAGTIFVLSFFAFLALLNVVLKRGKRRFFSRLEIRDGHVVITDEARLKLSKNPRKLRRIESILAKDYTVDEQGEIVMRDGNESKTPATAPEPDSSPGSRLSSTEPESAQGADKERFHSTWEEQDASPSIWSEADKAAFWGDAEKRD